MKKFNSSLISRFGHAITGHLRVAVIAIIFGMTAYGFIHILIWAINWIENL